MKYGMGEIVDNTFCQFDGRDEIAKCRDKIAPYPYTGTIKKTCSDFHQMAYALSYSMEEVQRIIRVKIGNKAWKHPLRFTDVINATIMAFKGASLGDISKDIWSKSRAHYTVQLPPTYGPDLEGIGINYVHNLLTAFFMFPIVWDRFFKPKLNSKIQLHSSIIELGDMSKLMLDSDYKMISSDLKYNDLSHVPIALSWGLPIETIKRIDEDYIKKNTPAPIVKPPVSATQVSTTQVPTPLATSPKPIKIHIPIRIEDKKKFTEFLPISQRLINVLLANKLNNINEILEYFNGFTREEFLEHDKFLRLQNFGRKSAREIFEYLESIKD